MRAAGKAARAAGAPHRALSTCPRSVIRKQFMMQVHPDLFSGFPRVRGACGPSSSRWGVAYTIRGGARCGDKLHKRPPCPHSEHASNEPLKHSCSTAWASCPARCMHPSP
jgi:hypothetical protein